MQTKEKTPIIPCEGREEVLRSCHYVEQVEVLSADYATINDAYKIFRFNCMFSGDDHENGIDRLADKRFQKQILLDNV